MERSLVGNTNDPVQTAAGFEVEKRGRQRDISDVAFLLSTIQGRRFLWRYLEDCGVYKTSHSHTSHHTAFLEGQRNVGLRIIADINDADPQALITMSVEHSREKEANDTRNKNGRNRRRNTSAGRDTSASGADDTDDGDTEPGHGLQ